MKFIAHRGNISGKQVDVENSTDYIDTAIDCGYDVEVDVWKEPSGFYLGHDSPSHKIDISFLDERRDVLWVHCKNILALYELKDDFNCFFHDTDDAVLTSKNYIWTYPNKQLVKNSIAVLPEMGYCGELLDCYGICTDNIEQFKLIL